MKFIDYVEPNIIDLNVPFRSKKRLFEQLSIKLGENGKEVRAIYDSLVVREKIGVTSLGNGVAIPHGKCLKNKEIKMRIMVLNKPVNYESVDETLVQLIVCTIFPKEGEKSHEVLLKNIGELFKKHRIFREIISAKTASEIKQIILAECK
jgi:mannitol/fructose-specific phosphotransferase system IIA component (Ntr-type)